MPNSRLKNAEVTFPPFEEHARTVFEQFRANVTDIFTAMDLNLSKPQDVARRLHLNKNLTWKISRIVREHDPAAAFPHMPGKAGLTILVDSLRKAGAPSAGLNALNDTLRGLDDLIEVHAGDRETFDMMIGGLARATDGQQQGESQRKLSFRGNSAVFGVQARVQLCVNFIAPSDDPQFVDLAWLSGLVDFRRLRGDTSWAIASARKATDDGTILPVGDLRAIDPDYHGEDCAPLLGKFCSNPIPAIRADFGADGFVRYELVEGPIGNTAAATCIVGIYGRRFVRRVAEANDTMGEHVARLNTPVELLIHDFFVHKDLKYAFSPDVFLYSQLPSLPPFPKGGRKRGLLPLYEKIQSLGKGSSAVLTPELPQYHGMIESVFTRLEWKDKDFHVFRFIMKYPPIPTLAVLRYDLPKA